MSLKVIVLNCKISLLARKIFKLILLIMVRAYFLLWESDILRAMITTNILEEHYSVFIRES